MKPGASPVPGTPTIPQWVPAKLLLKEQAQWLEDLPDGDREVWLTDESVDSPSDRASLSPELATGGADPLRTKLVLRWVAVGTRSTTCLVH